MAHLTKAEMMGQYAESRGVKPGKLATQVTGVQIGAGALLVLLGVWMDLGFIVLALFLLGTAFLMHAFWKESDAVPRMNELTQFMKDLALAGAAITLLAAVWIIGDDLGLTITGPLFNP